MSMDIWKRIYHGKEDNKSYLVNSEYYSLLVCQTYVTLSVKNY